MRFCLLSRIQVLPAVAEDGQDHGGFCENLVKNSRPGAYQDIINDPQGGIDEHTHHPDGASVAGVAADGGCNVGRL